MATILVIDDEPDLRDDIADALRCGGHRTLEAANGRQGLELILRESPDLVISDINMPVMDGRELLEILNAHHPECRTIPFLFLSAFGDREHVIAGKRLGADDYLTKPVDHELMVETVNARVRQAERFGQQKRMEIEALQRAVLLALPHELRTPLNGVLGFAELIETEVKRGRASQQAGEYATMILASGRRLQSLIENVLDLAAIIAGRISPEHTEIDLQHLLDECADVVRADAEKAEVQVAVRAPADLPLVRSDPRLLRRAVLELLANAIKYTQRDGHVVVSAEIDRGDFVKIEIVDTGKGIDSKWLPQIGTPFAKPNAGELARADEGAGLGLSLARAFVGLLGGELTLTSQVRVGTTAAIRLAIDAA